MPSIFITRPLEASSVLYDLDRFGCKLHGESLIDIEPVSFQLPEQYEWVFFYSQHGVQSFFTKIDDRSKILEARYGAFGPKTAEAATKFVDVHFIGSGRSADTAPGFETVARGQRVIFARASNSMRSVQSKLLTVDVIDIIVYNNLPKSTFDLPHHEWAILTSPLNAKTYVGQYGYNTSTRMVAIGHSTALALREMGVQDVLIPTNPSEESVRELLLHYMGTPKASQHD